jgi:hypothetical protein
MATIHLYQLGTISCLCFLCRVHFLFPSPVISEVSHTFSGWRSASALSGNAVSTEYVQSLSCYSLSKAVCGTKYAVHKSVTMAPLISQPELFCLFATCTRRMPVFGRTYLSAQGALTTGLMSHERVANCASLRIMRGNGVQGSLSILM